MPTNIPTTPTRQINHTALEILWGSPPTRGNPLTYTLQPFLILQQRLVHICRDISRCNSIHCYAFGGPFIGEGLCELCDSTFGGSVGWDGESALEGEQGCEVYDGAPAAGDL